MIEFCRTIEQRPSLFEADLSASENDLAYIIRGSRFLVIGGGGSIGQAVVKQLLQRTPNKLHVVDLSENNLAELVRDVRSSFLNVPDDFRTFALDIASEEFDYFIRTDGEYDYILNLAALKHVRSEKDPYTLMRMLRVNTQATRKMLALSSQLNISKYFSVSSDKASRPANLMGASKRIMEMQLYQAHNTVAVASARFANVAFSDGSLLHSFKMRMAKHQPIVAPNDIKRYFIADEEAGQLCVMACLLGENSDIFFPKLDAQENLIPLASIARRYIENQGYEMVLCETEEEARRSVTDLHKQGKWPCFLSPSDTTGEKPFEAFFDESEAVDQSRFASIGIVKDFPNFDANRLHSFEQGLENYLKEGQWSKEQLVELMCQAVPEFTHVELGKSLDEKM